MKNILATAAAAFLLVTSTGCSGFLDEELKSSLSPDNTYTSSYGFEVGVNGLYGWARSEFNTWGGATTSQGQACPYESFQVATDIVYTGHGDGSLVPFENLSYTPSTTFVTSYWNWGYGLRLEGYHAAMARCGLPVAEGYVVTSDFEFGGGFSAMQQLLALPQRPQAVFVGLLLFS